MSSRGTRGVAALVVSLLAMPLVAAVTPLTADAAINATETITDARHYVTYLPEPFGPKGLTSGPGGQLWFVAPGNVIGRIDPVTHVTQTWPVAYGGAQGFAVIDNIAAAGDGTLWFTDRFASGISPAKVGRFDPVTQAVTVFFTSSPPNDIATAPDGSVWFTEPKAAGNFIGHLTLAGVLSEYPLLTPVPCCPNQPFVKPIDGIVAGPDGNMWFNEKYQNKIGRITPAGVITEFNVPTANADTSDIASADGFLWFTETAVDKIGRLDPATGAITELSTGSGADAAPYLIIAGPDGHPWFSAGYTYNNFPQQPGYIARMNAAGVITQAFLTGGTSAQVVDDQGATVTGMLRPDYLALGPDGNVWFSSTGADNPKQGFGRLVPPLQPPPPPTVTGMAPQSGTAVGSTRVVITGTGLAGASVRYDGVEVTSTTDSNTRLTLVTPPRPAGTVVQVSVLAPGSSTPVNAGTYTYTPAGPPSGLVISPSSAGAQGGATVKISGTNLEGATFDFGGIPVTGSRDNLGVYTITVPPATATPTVTVTATTALGTTSAPFTYTTDSSRLGGPPVLLSLDPDTGSPAGGQNVRITGRNLFNPSVQDGSGGTVALVRFGTANVFTTSYQVFKSGDPSDPTKGYINVSAPAHALGTVSVTVTTEAGVSNALPFTYTDVARPVVSAISPDSGPEGGGTATTITGTGFAAGATPVQVFFGGTAATSFTVTSDTTIQAVTPAGVGLAPVTVRTQGGTSSFPYGSPQDGVRFTYISSLAPVISRVSPNTGNPDGGFAEISITGAHFAGATSVTFGATTVAPGEYDGTGPVFRVVSDTKIIVFPYPAGTGTVDLRVTTPSGTSAFTPVDAFTYIPGPTVTSLSPDTGPTTGGTRVTIFGQNLFNTSEIYFGSDRGTNIVVAPDGASLQVTTPVGSDGAYPAGIQLTTPSGTFYDPNIVFTYTDPPAPTFVVYSPPNSGRVNVAYAGYTFYATGTPAPTYAVASGALPPGLTLNATTGRLSGTPTASGTYNFTVRATNGNSPDAVTPNLRIIIAPAAPTGPVLTTTSTPPSRATVGSIYGPFTFTASGDPAPTFVVDTGALPPGLSLNPTTGVLTGTPTATGVYGFTVRAVNGVGPGYASGTYVITVDPAPPSPPTFTAVSPAAIGSVGTAYAYTFTASGNPAPTFTVASGALPSGLALNASTGALSGTPTASGTFTFTVRASNGQSPDAVSGSLTISVAPAVVGGTFTPVAPSRILDTRFGTGTCTGGCTAVGPGQTLTLQVAGKGGVPASGASAVLMNMTAVAGATTYLTVYPSDAPQPTASNLNVEAGRTTPNLVSVKLGADGAVKVFNSTGSVQVIADVAGWYDNGSLAPASRFNPVAPGRVLDTRFGTGTCTGGCTAVGPGETRILQVAGQGGVPATGATAVVMNVTVVGPTAESYLTVYPSDAPPPLASNLNFRAGQTVPNLVVVKLGADGKVTIVNNSGTTQVIADVAGWYGAPGASAGTRFTPVTPARVLDTRNGTGTCTGGCTPVGPGQTLTLQVAGQGGVPAVGATAVVMNMTATQPTAEGYATVWPSDAPQPTASNLNFVAGQTVANLVTVKLGADGKVKIFNASGTTSYIADVAGWFNNGG